MNFKINKFLNVITFLLISFFIYSYTSFKNSILNNHFELRNIELIIDSDIEYVQLFNEKINQYDDLVWYSYIDNSNDILIYNSLKNKSIEELKIYEQLFRNSSIDNFLINLIEIEWSDDEFIDHINILSQFIDTLYEYVNFSKIDNEIGTKIINALLNIDNLKFNKEHKIIIKSNKSFSNHFKFIKDYNRFYDFINTIDDSNIRIKKINFNNEFLYNQCSESALVNTRLELNNCIICYSKTIKEIQDSINELKNLNIDFRSSTILDLIITEDISGDKYKLINKILINSNNFKKIEKPELNKFIDLMVDLESTILNLEKFNNELSDSIYKTKMIIDFYQNSINNYSYYFNLANSYNKTIKKHIDLVANTEKFTEDKLSLFVINDYKRNGSYISRLFINNEDSDLLNKSFNFETSVK
ncbi:MAG: hypothetical protein CMG50_05735 [Candidatus Marinimicrobia bacterium]|nr:hypothetical protein [Candidatus Neomarinimicrobiota bacterium]